MVPQPVQSELLAASRDLQALLATIDAEHPALAVATPERQRLTLTAWIARARAAEALLGGQWARQQAARVIERVHHLGRLWWPGRIAALDPRATPMTAWPGLRTQSWRDLSAACVARLGDAEDWADDGARIPPPHDADELFRAACDLLASFGGPLGRNIALDRSPAVIADARRRHPSLVRAAATLRWLRGTAPAGPWGLAFGRLRGLARALEDVGDLAALLSPTLVPLRGWAIHLGRDPARERLLSQRPPVDGPDDELLDWLVAAFDLFDTPTLADLCAPLAARILALQASLPDRRHRRRLERLRRHLLPRPEATAITPSRAVQPPTPASDLRLPALRSQLAGRRALFVGNRSAPEIEALLAEHLGVRCTAVDTASHPRRRRSVHARILHGAYDLVLIAHGFTGHAETEQLGAACRQAGVSFWMVDKGRFARIVDVLWTHRDHPGLVARANPDSAA